jgi:hypothetical protein
VNEHDFLAVSSLRRQSGRRRAARRPNDRMTPVGTGARISEQPLWREYDETSHEMNEGHLSVFSMEYSRSASRRISATRRVCVDGARRRGLYSNRIRARLRPASQTQESHSQENRAQNAAPMHNVASQHSPRSVQCALRLPTAERFVLSRTSKTITGVAVEPFNTAAQ